MSRPGLKQVADLSWLFTFIGGTHLLDFLAHFIQHPLHIRPIKAHASGTLLVFLGKAQSRQRHRHTVQQTGLLFSFCLPFLGLELFPVVTVYGKGG